VIRVPTIRGFPSAILGSDPMWGYDFACNAKGIVFPFLFYHVETTSYSWGKNKWLIILGSYEKLELWSRDN
jgi:hypothetical protein